MRRGGGDHSQNSARPPVEAVSRLKTPTTLLVAVSPKNRLRFCADIPATPREDILLIDNKRGLDVTGIGDDRSDTLRAVIHGQVRSPAGERRHEMRCVIQQD